MLASSRARIVSSSVKGLDDADALQRLLHGLEDTRAAGELPLGDGECGGSSCAGSRIAGGTTTKPKNDITGSWTTITVTRPISDSRSRPIAPITRLSAWLAAAAPVVSRARNSDECRSAKKPRFWWISVANIRRWLSAMMRLPIRARFTAGGRSRIALTMKITAVTMPSIDDAGKILDGRRPG